VTTLPPTGLEGWLSPRQVAAYLALTGTPAPPRKPGLDYLHQLLANSYARVPFQNLTLLCGPEHPPSLDRIARDMLAGIGGLCTTINPFLCALLQSVGYSVGMLRVSMAQPDCHIGLLLSLHGQRYWLDAANGFPYLRCLALKPGAGYHQPHFSYTIGRSNSGDWQLAQTPLGSRDLVVNQRFRAVPVNYAGFRRMRRLHYSDPSYGPFQLGIRINCWYHGGGHVLRDHIVLDLGGQPQRVDRDGAVRWLQQSMPRAAGRLEPMLHRAWDRLNMAQT